MAGLGKFDFKQLKKAPAKDRVSVGVDIGTAFLKIIKLKFGKDGAELLHYTLEPARSDTGSALKKILLALEVKKVNFSLSGPSTIIRYVNFPAMKDDEMRQSLKFEAQKHIPFTVSEVNIDGSILKPSLPDNKMLVMLAAAKKDFINQRLKIFEDAGVKVNAIDIDSIAIVNAFGSQFVPDEKLKTKAVALLNIGASFCNLSIFEEGIPRLSRDMQMAGNLFTQRIADSLGVDFKAAEILKLKADKESASKVNLAVESVLCVLAGELRTSFDYYESQSTSSVVKIFLSGGSAQCVGLSDSLANQLGIEVEIWNPFKNIKFAKDVDFGKAQVFPGQLAVALGVALHS